MRDIMPDVERWRERGEKVAIATVISMAGSAPRGPGAKLAVSESGEVELQTETRTQDPSNGFCVRPYVVLFDGEGQVLQTVGKGQPWCVGSIRGADVGIPNPPTRKDAFRAKLSVGTTARIRHVSVVHEIGSKDVAAAILVKQRLRECSKCQQLLINM